MHEPHVPARHHHQVKGWEGSPAAAMENGGDGEERARAGGGPRPGDGTVSMVGGGVGPQSSRRNKRQRP